MKNQDHKFDIALHLGFVEDAYNIASSVNDVLKLRQVGDLAL